MNSVLLSSGFVIQANPGYVPISEHISIIESLLSVNRINYSTFDKQKLIEENVHINARNNEIYKDYITTKSYESSMAMVDSIHEDLSLVPVYIWVKMQLEGSKLSSIVKSHLLSFLKDLISDKESSAAQLYIPFNLRLNPKVLDKNVDQYVKELDKMSASTGYVSAFPGNWKNFIVLLHKKGKLVEFYKLVFVDFY